MWLSHNLETSTVLPWMTAVTALTQYDMSKGRVQGVHTSANRMPTGGLSEKSQRESLHTAVKTSPVMSIKCARCGEASHMSMCQCVWKHLCGVSLLVSGIVCCVVGG